MKVLYDHQVFSFQDYGGISRYFSRLISCFADHADVQTEMIVKYSNNRLISTLPGIIPKPFFPKRRFKGRNEIIRHLNQSHFHKEYRKRTPPDIFHPTYYHPYFLKSIGDVPFVLTIYDMAHEHHPSMFHPLDFTIKNKKILAAKADRIIAISEHTKNDIISILGVPTTKIDVIPLAADIRVFDRKDTSVSLPDHYVLYVGARNTYKNFPFFLRAMKEVLLDMTGLQIVCAGGGRFTQSELRKIDALQLTDKVHHIEVDDETLAFAYTRASAFVYPSLYEGFGIPILEAFTCGAPAVLSNRSSLPEVGGDAAIYFDPEQSESLVEAVRSILKNNDVAEEYKRKGRERIKNFSWEKTAEKTLRTYKKIIN